MTSAAESAPKPKASEVGISGYPRTKMAILYRCPHCGGFAVCEVSREVLLRNRKHGSLVAPVRTFCPNPLGTCTAGRPNAKHRRGRVQVRLISRNYDHCWAMVSKRQRMRLDNLAESLNMDLRIDPNAEITRAQAISEYDPSWTVGLNVPIAFRLNRRV